MGYSMRFACYRGGARVQRHFRSFGYIMSRRRASSDRKIINRLEDLVKMPFQLPTVLGAAKQAATSAVAEGMKPRMSP